MDMKRKLEVMEEINDANKRHVEEWKQEQEAPHNFYFTFGTDPLFPYGYHDYVLIRCRDESDACRLFNARFPKRPGHNVMNCAFMYNEAQWEKSVKQHYADREPAESIIVMKPGNR